MPFCTKCGNKIEENAAFCSVCGTPAVQPASSAGSSISSLVFKYQKNAMFMMLTEPLAVNLDGQINFRLPDGRETWYNVQPGNHTLTAYVPYLGGSKYGAVTKNFYVGPNETLEILYKPPMAIFMQGNLIIRKIR